MRESFKHAHLSGYIHARYILHKEIPCYVYNIYFTTSARSMSIPFCYCIPVHAYRFGTPCLLCLLAGFVFSFFQLILCEVGFYFSRFGHCRLPSRLLYTLCNVTT